ncbi:MAG: hypothetical protein ACRC62_32765 [Microcoleus sp.]
MPIIKIAPREVNVGHETCGFAPMRATQYLTADEREYISHAIADRPTNDQLTADLVEATYKGRQGYKKGDLLDYLSDSTKVAQSVRTVIESSEPYQELLASPAYEQYIGECNANALTELKAFVELRIVDDEDRENIKAMTVKQFGTPGEFCPNFKLFDYLYMFYSCEQRGIFYREDMVNERTQSSFLLLHFPDEPIATSEVSSVSSIPNSISALLATDLQLDGSLSPECQISSEQPQSENDSSTINELPQ